MLESDNLLGTFFRVTTTAQSFPLTAADVRLPWLIALKADFGRASLQVKKW